MNTKKLITTALFAALIFAATFVIKIPIPVSGGYVHPGDSFVMMSGMILGPVYGTLAAAIGSLLSDLVGGYIVYVPATAIIKGLIALCCYFALHGLIKEKKNRMLALVTCGIIDILFVVFGYFVYESILFGTSVALVSLIPNAVQGVFGLVLTCVLYPRIEKIKYIREIV